jgi:hypothetical protein
LANIGQIGRWNIKGRREISEISEIGAATSVYG